VRDEVVVPGVVRTAAPDQGPGCDEALAALPSASALLLAIWLLLNQSIEPAQLLLGTLLAVAVPLLTRPLRPLGDPRIHRPFALFRLLWHSAIEIVRSCFNVSQIILLRRSADVNSQFIRVPLDLHTRTGWPAVLPDQLHAGHGVGGSAARRT
jgi:multisubunit Na+/H+ antiporter MnhE subunit